MTRLQQLESKGFTPELPPLNVAAHLAEYLFDVGPVGYGAMGPIPISHAEIDAWQRNTGIDLDAWEARALRRLSMEYLTSMQDAKAIDCPAPFTFEPEPDRRQVVEKNVRAIFGARTQPARKKGH